MTFEEWWESDRVPPGTDAAEKDLAWAAWNAALEPAYELIFKTPSRDGYTGAELLKGLFAEAGKKK